MNKTNNIFTNKKGNMVLLNERSKIALWLDGKYNGTKYIASNCSKGENISDLKNTGALLLTNITI